MDVVGFVRWKGEKVHNAKHITTTCFRVSRHLPTNMFTSATTTSTKITQTVELQPSRVSLSTWLPQILNSSCENPTLLQLPDHHNLSVHAHLTTSTLAKQSQKKRSTGSHLVTNYTEQKTTQNDLKCSLIMAIALWRGTVVLKGFSRTGVYDILIGGSILEKPFYHSGYSTGWISTTVLFLINYFLGQKIKRPI